jgi:ABC-type metal ion transport system substrate-binding protein
MRNKLGIMAAGLMMIMLSSTATAQDRIKVGVSGGDGELIWAKVKEVAKRKGLDVDVVVFNDYLLPNAALDGGDLDANAFQHRPFLENQVKTRGYKIVAIALDAAQLPRSLPDVDAAIINTNYALQAKLSPRKDAIAIEGRTNNPYGNIIAVRARDEDKRVFKTLVAAYQSDEIRQFILSQFDGAILPVF